MRMRCAFMQGLQQNESGTRGGAACVYEEAAIADSGGPLYLEWSKYGKTFKSTEDNRSDTEARF